MSGGAESGAAVSGAAVSATEVSGAAESELVPPSSLLHAASSITATTPGLTNLRHVCDFVIVFPPSRAAGCGFDFVVHCPVTAAGRTLTSTGGRGRQSGCRPARSNVACRSAVCHSFEFANRPIPPSARLPRALPWAFPSNADVEVKLTLMSGSTKQLPTRAKITRRAGGESEFGCADLSAIGHTEGERLSTRRHLEGAGSRLACSLGAAVLAVTLLGACGNPPEPTADCVGVSDDLLQVLQEGVTVDAELRNGKIVEATGAPHAFVSAEVHMRGDDPHSRGDIATWAVDDTGAEQVRAVDIVARNQSSWPAAPFNVTEPGGIGRERAPT